MIDEHPAIVIVIYGSKDIYPLGNNRTETGAGPVQVPVV